MHEKGDKHLLGPRLFGQAASSSLQCLHQITRAWTFLSLLLLLRFTAALFYQCPSLAFVFRFSNKFDSQDWMLKKAPAALCVPQDKKKMDVIILTNLCVLLNTMRCFCRTKCHLQIMLFNARRWSSGYIITWNNLKVLYYTYFQIFAFHPGFQ